MQSFIVLGLIPGTQFETTFTFWVVVAGLFFALLNVSTLFLIAEKIRTLIVIAELNSAINSFELRSFY